MKLTPAHLRFWHQCQRQPSWSFRCKQGKYAERRVTIDDLIPTAPPDQTHSHKARDYKMKDCGRVASNLMGYVRAWLRHKKDILPELQRVAQCKTDCDAVLQSKYARKWANRIQAGRG